VTGHEGGSVLVAVVGLAGLVAVVATGTLTLARQTDAIARRQVASVRAVSAAAGGVEVARIVLSDPDRALVPPVMGTVGVEDRTLVRFATVAGPDATLVTTVTAEQDGSVHVVEVRTHVLARP